MKSGRENLRSLPRDVRQPVHRQGWPNGSGTQQYLCKAYGAHRVRTTKGSAIDPEREAIILRVVEVERLSLQAAEHIFGVARQTVAKVARRKAATLPVLTDTLLPAEKGAVLEPDELHRFVGS